MAAPKAYHRLQIMGPSSNLPSKPSSVCNSCWEGPFAAQLGLFDKPVDWVLPDDPKSAGYSYLTSWADLESRAAEGCSWCRLILKTCSDDHTSITSASLTVTVGKSVILNRKYTPAGTQGLKIYVNGMYRYSGYVYVAPDDPAAEFVVARTRILDVGSPRSLALAKACLDECVNGHGHCGAHSLPPEAVLPTRLVDCTDPSRPHLVSTGGTRGSYVALSYVWGEAQPHSTTVAYAKGIDPARLPQTIRDAIHVTNALGSRFLWADSLCIVQDSDEDKRREIGCMRHIYRDARLTIIASCARRVGEGFLQDRPAILETGDNAFPRDVALPFIYPQGVSAYAESRGSQVSEPRVGTIYVYATATASDPFGYTLPPYNPTQEPISARRWCMQKFFMSPRALIFSSHTLLFRCQTHTWLMAVEDYSRREITVPSDKLVACAGVAEEFQRVLRSEYLAGLWRETLLEDLLWLNHRQRYNTGWLSRPTEYRAPSWSWAAVDGGVYTSNSGSMRRVAEVLACETVLEDTALRFGRVIGGSLVLRAPLVPCTLRRTDQSHHVSLQLGRKEQGGHTKVESEAGSRDEVEVPVTTELPGGEGNVDSEEDAGIQHAVSWLRHRRSSHYAKRQDK